MMLLAGSCAAGRRGSGGKQRTADGAGGKQCRPDAVGGKLY